jgi:hypothetical protein
MRVGVGRFGLRKKTTAAQGEPPSFLDLYIPLGAFFSSGIPRHVGFLAGRFSVRLRRSKSRCGEGQGKAQRENRN